MALTFGSEYTFNSATTNYSKVAKLDSTHFVTIYTDAGNSSYGTARVGLVDGNQITYGAESTFYNATCNYHDVAVLDSTHFVVVYKNASDSKLYSRIGVVSSGTTISWGAVSAAMSYADCGYYLKVAASSSTQFSVQFQDANNAYYSTCKKGTVSGNAITVVGGSMVLNSSVGTTLAQIAVSTDNYVNFYNTAGNYGYARYNLGTEQAFYTGSVMSASAVLLDSTHFAVAYRKPTSTYFGYVRIGTISGTSISFGTEYTFNNGDTNHLSITALDSTHIVISYADTNNYGTVITATVSGSEITFDSEIAFNSATTSYTGICELESSKIVIVYKDGGNSSYGNAIIGAGSTTHDLECDFSGTSTVTVTLDRFKELATSISASASASASLDVQSTSMSVAMSGSGTLSASLDRVKELEFGIETHGLVSDALYQAKALSTTIQASAASTLILETAPIITLSSVTDFNQAQTETISVCTLDSSHFAIAYKDYTSDTIKDGRMKIAVRDGASVEYEPEYTFYADMTSPSTALMALDSTHGIVAYQNNSTQGSVKLFTYAYGGITFGSEYTFSDGSQFITQIKLHRISATKFIISFLSANYPKAIVGTISSGVVSFGTTTSVNGSYCYSHSAAILDDTHVAFAYNISGYAYTRIGTIGSTSISLVENHTQFNTGGTTCISNIDVIDSTHYVIAYQDGNNSSRGTVRIVSVSGSTPTLGSEYVFTTETTTTISVQKKTDYSISITYVNSSFSGYTIIGFIGAGDSFTFSPRKPLGSVETISTSKIDGFQYAIAYNPYVSYANRATRYGKLVFADYGNLVPLYLTIAERVAISSLANQTIGLRLNSNPCASLNISGGIERNLSASISTVADVVYELYRALGLSTQLEARAYMTPYLQQARDLQLAMEAVSSATAGLDAIKALQVLIEQVSSTTAHGKIERDLHSAMDAVSEIAARAEVDIGLRTDITSTASMSLSILRLCDLVDAIAANGTVTSGLSLDIILSSVFNPHSELYAKAYIELTGSCVIEEHADFALTMEHVATLASLIQGSASADMNPELTHLLASFVDAKANVFASFNTIIEAMLAIDQTSSMTAEGMVFHGIELICALDTQASAFFTVDRIAELSAQIDSSVTMVSVLSNLLRAYLEFKGSIDKEIALSGILANKINYTGKLGDKIIYFNGSIL